MMKLKEYICMLPRAQILQIIRDKELLDRDGGIGDCVLRETVEKYMEILGIAEISTIMWMELVANYAFRYIAMEYLDQTGEL